MFRRRLALWKARHMEDETPGRRGLRLVLLACVFAAVCWGFWRNNQRRLDDLAMQHVVRDDTGRLARTEREGLAVWARRIQATHGLRIQIWIHAQGSGMRQAQFGEILVDILPSSCEAAISAPPLTRRALGDQLTPGLERAFVRQCAQEGWRAGLAMVLEQLETALREASS